MKGKLGIEFFSYVEQVGDIKTDIDFESVTTEQIESNIVRCPDPEAAKKMQKLIEEVRDDGDSIGVSGERGLESGRRMSFTSIFVANDVTMGSIGTRQVL